MHAQVGLFIRLTPFAPVLLALAATRVHAAPATLPVAPAPAGARWIDVTRYGAVGDGATDDTAAFRAAAATKANLLIPKPPEHYKLTGKVLVHGSIAGDGSLPEIRMYGADGDDSHVMFEVNNYTGARLVISGLHLNGQWDGVSTHGEFSHLINIVGSNNVTVENNVLEKPYGDCVWVGTGFATKTPTASENVMVRANRMYDPRRCNIAVIMARKVSIQRNFFRKSNNYVSAVDLETNINSFEFIQDVDISENKFEVPGGIAISIFSPAGNPQLNGRITVSSNAAHARRFFLKANNSGPWHNIAITKNTFYGDRATPGYEHVSFVEIDQEPRYAARSVTDVIVQGNTISNAVTPGQSYRDYFRGVQRLRVLENRWLGALPYELLVLESPRARVSGNQLPRSGADKSKSAR